VALAAKLDDPGTPTLTPLARQTPSDVTAALESESTFATLDSSTQGLLTARSDTQACAYLLGRGLAECYWAQDGTVRVEKKDARGRVKLSSCWTVLTESRRDELSRMVGRLAAYFNRYTAPAVAGTLAVWYVVGCDEDWREGICQGFWRNNNEHIDVDDELYRQIRRWYELLVLGQDPSALIRASALLRSPKAMWTVVKGLAVPLVVAAVGVVLLAFFASFLSTGDHGQVAKVVTGTVGALGVTVASIMAKAKAQALKLLSRAQDDAYTDLITLQILTVTRPRRHLLDPRRAGDVRDKKLTVGA
jgi:hypothetical protein